MKLISALFTHAWLVFRLKHDGTGMPTKFPATLLLTTLYAVLILVNKHINDGINLETLIGLSFISQFYIFCLRNKLIGLIILISIVTNVLSLMLTTLAHIPEENLYLLLILEYIMVFAAIINIIRSHTKIV